MSVPQIAGIHHVVLSVSDLGRSVDWYCRVLDFAPLFPLKTDDFDRQLLIHPSGIILGLTQHKGPEADTAFDARSPGLDHLSFAVSNLADLEAWVDRLESAGVEHSGLQSSMNTGFTLVPFRDPDRIQLELYLSDPVA